MCSFKACTLAVNRSHQADDNNLSATKLFSNVDPQIKQQTGKNIHFFSFMKKV